MARPNETIGGLTVSGIKISKELVRQLPKEQAKGIEDYLWKKTGGVCFLCEQKMNLATDEIEADHDSPQSAGGQTDRDNLNLVHASCNRAKKNSPSSDVRPFLKLKAFAHQRGSVIGFSDAQQHFGFTPQTSVLEWSTDQDVATWHFPDGNISSSQVFKESDGRGTDYCYTFITVPGNALYNDNECQPRNIKLPHVWAIYSDIQNNPLHEPPSCRILPNAGNSTKLVMFDGQHKTVAMWMHGKKSIVAKVYLDLNQEQTLRLVGSIQSRIKKMPLSSFEGALKMGEEWAAHAERYEAKVGADKVSEYGLINSIDLQERRRAKDAFQSQLLKEVLELEDLTILDFVARDGRPRLEAQTITETVFKNKVVKNLRQLNPLQIEGDDWLKARARELENLKFALNVLTNYAFLNQEGADQLSEFELKRRRRISYQSSLAYIAELIRKVYVQVLLTDEESSALLEKEPTDEQKTRIQASIERIVNHPIWTCDLEQYDLTKAVADSLSKNQNAATAFRNVQLTVGYAMGGDILTSDWSG